MISSCCAHGIRLRSGGRCLKRESLECRRSWRVRAVPCAQRASLIEVAAPARRPLAACSLQSAFNARFATPVQSRSSLGTQFSSTTPARGRWQWPGTQRHAPESAAPLSSSRSSVALAESWWAGPAHGGAVALAAAQLAHWHGHPRGPGVRGLARPRPGGSFKATLRPRGAAVPRPRPSLTKPH